MVEDIRLEISKMQARIEFLKKDRTVVNSIFSQGGTPYNHGPYFRKLETKNLKAKIKRREVKLKKLLDMANKHDYRKELEEYVTNKLNNSGSVDMVGISRSVDHLPILADHHIINIGISILETKYPEIGPGYAGGGFVQAVVDNNLMEAMGRADHICANNIKFFCTLLYNFSPYHLKSYSHEMQG